MLKKKKWVATVRENNWVVAKVSLRKENLKVLRLEEFHKVESKSEEVNPRISADSADFLGDKREEEGIDRVSQDDSDFALLNEWLKKKKIPLKKLQLAFSCSGVITRMITIPELKEKDLEKLLTEQIDQYFTLDVSDYIVDYRILEKVEEDGQKRLRVLLVAIPLAEWEKQWNLWSKLGFEPKVTDFSADCLCRLYRRLSGWDDKKDHVPMSDLAIIDLGAERVEFVLMEHGILFLYSDMEIALGGLNIPLETQENKDSEVVLEAKEALETEKGIEPEKVAEPETIIEPEKFLESAGSPELAMNLEFEWNPGTEEVIDQGIDELEDRLFPVFNTLREFLNFFASRHYGKTVDQIYITGECADYPNLEELFERNIGVQSKVGFPGEWKPIFKKKYGKFEDQWMKYGSLYGLAIRED